MTSHLFQDPPPRRAPADTDVSIGYWEEWLDRFTFASGLDPVKAQVQTDGYDLDTIYAKYLDGMSAKQAAVETIAEIATCIRGRQ